MEHKDDAATLPEKQSCARLWADLCTAAPSLVAARAVTADGRLITAAWSQRDVVTSTLRNFAVSYAQTDQCGAHATFAPVEMTAGSQFSSPSGRRMVRFVESSHGDVAKDTIVEVWGQGSLLHNSAEFAGVTGLEAVWKVPAKTHGPVYSDDWFAGVAWSPDESMFIYVADRPQASAERDCDEAVGGSGNEQRDSEDTKSRDVKRIASSLTCDGKTDADTWIDGLRNKFDHSARDPLGETYIDRKSPALFLADTRRLATCAICVEDPENSAFEAKDLFGDPQWSPDGRWVAVTRRPAPTTEESVEADGIAEIPYNLGVRFCYNRYSSVEVFPAPKSMDDAPALLHEMIPVTDHTNFDDFCCSSPRFTPDSRHLIYVSAPRKYAGRAASTAQPHNTSKVLRGVTLAARDSPEDLSPTTPVTILDVVHFAKPGEFPGLHLHALPRRPWLGRSHTLLFSSLWGSMMRVLAVKVDFGSDGAHNRGPQPLSASDIVPWDVPSGGTEELSVSVLDVCSSGAVVAVSSHVQAPQLGFLRRKEGAFELKYISKLSNRAQQLQSIAHPIKTYDLTLHPSTNLDSIDSSLPAREYVVQDGLVGHARFQATLVIPKVAVLDKRRVPLIVNGHGGPHASCVNAYTLSVAALLLSGKAVLLVNYRGSQGLDQSSLESLPGHAGSQDVAEVVQATQWALQVCAPALLDAERVGYIGGSHGGFLGAHLSVLPATPIKRTCLRNPVVNIASMVQVTDIPEWAFCEAGVRPVSATTGLALTPDPPALARMWKVSPVARVKKGSAAPGPTLLFVGGGDRRVPPEQSVEWMKLITEAFGAGIVTMRWYKGSGHAIDEVPNGDDVWVHTLEFLDKL